MIGALSASGVDAGYNKRAVVSGIDITALKGQVLCLIGPNGAGKSTILRTLSGLLAPVSGTVYVGEDSIHSLAPKAKARRLAVVLTDRQSPAMASAREIVAMGRTPYTGFFGRLSASDWTVVDDALASVSAADLADMPFANLSDGQKQKVLIARALAQEPEVLVLDEPTSFLDVRHKIELVRTVRSLAGRKGLTVILALHEIDIAAKVAHVIFMVKDGQIALQGSPEDVIRQESVADLYGLDGAVYNPVTGSIEMTNEGQPEIFVVAGAGAGAPVYRALSRTGLGLATGILSEGDIDCSVARAMRLSVVSQESFAPYSEDSYALALSMAMRCGAMVDSGFPVAEFNQANVRLMNEYAKDGGIVYTLRSRDEASLCFDDISSLVFADSAGDLAGMLSAKSASGELHREIAEDEKSFLAILETCQEGRATT